MRSLNSVGLGLSLVFGCLLLALVAELYYLLWWKRRITNREIQDDFSSPAREFLYMFCWKKPTSLTSTALQTDTQVHEPQAQQLHSNKDLWFKPYGGEDDSVETELLRLQNLAGPPRFLFTIKEETKEDLDSEDKSRKGSSRGRSLSDLVLTVETPFLTPLASPPYFTPPLTPMKNGFNPLFQLSSDAEFIRMRSSPPPKFKFLRDAEDKLYRRKLMEDVELGGAVVQDDDDDGVKVASTSKFIKDEENGSFITLIVGKNKERDFGQQQLNFPQYPSSSSQVLPLAASPPTFRSQSNKNPVSS